MTQLVCTPEEFLAAAPAERAKLVLAQIDLTPELWDQEVWLAPHECGTAACFAGWTCLLAGAKPNETEAIRTPEGLVDMVFATVQYEGRRRMVATLAEELLGLDKAISDYYSGHSCSAPIPEDKLFDADNSRAVIVRLLEEIYE